MQVSRQKIRTQTAIVISSAINHLHIWHWRSELKSGGWRWFARQALPRNGRKGLTARARLAASKKVVDALLFAAILNQLVRLPLARIEILEHFAVRLGLLESRGLRLNLKLERFEQRSKLPLMASHELKLCLERMEIRACHAVFKDLFQAFKTLGAFSGDLIALVSGSYARRVQEGKTQPFALFVNATDTQQRPEAKLVGH